MASSPEQPPERIVVQGSRLSEFLHGATALAAVFAASVALWQSCQTAGQLQVALAVSRPFLSYEPAKVGDFERVDLYLINSGPVPARIISENNNAFRSRIRVNRRNATEQSIVPAPRRVRTAQMILPEAAQEKIRAGEVTMHIGACGIYGSVSEEDTRTWKATGLFLWDPGRKEFVTLSRDDIAARPDDDCEWPEK